MVEVEEGIVGGTIDALSVWVGGVCGVDGLLGAGGVIMGSGGFAGAAGVAVCDGVCVGADCDGRTSGGGVSRPVGERFFASSRLSSVNSCGN